MRSGLFANDNFPLARIRANQTCDPWSIPPARSRERSITHRITPKWRTLKDRQGQVGRFEFAVDREIHEGVTVLHKNYFPGFEFSDSVDTIADMERKSHQVPLSRATSRRQFHWRKQTADFFSRFD